jgi:hypothetical protein
MRSFLQGDPAVIVGRAPLLLILGVLAFGLSRTADGHGGITAIFLFGLGVAGASLSSWRSERGLWMLAALYFVINASIYWLMIWGQLRDVIRGVRPESIALAVDMFMGTALLAIEIRFLARIAKDNFALSRFNNER